MTAIFCITLISACAAQAPAEPPDPDRASLQGTWKAVASELGGEKEKNPGRNSLIFDGDTFLAKDNDKVVMKGTYRLDTTTTPKQIDLFIQEGPDHLKGKTSHGIYQVDGDTLRWASGTPGTNARPGDFGSTQGTEHMLVTLQKLKK